MTPLLSQKDWTMRGRFALNTAVSAWMQMRMITRRVSHDQTTRGWKKLPENIRDVGTQGVRGAIIPPIFGKLCKGVFSKSKSALFA